jgi:hypothetical protein
MPERTIHVLAELETLGFTDADFQILQPGGTISSHRAYCTNSERLDYPGTHYALKYRLELVLDRFRLHYGRRTAGDTGVPNVFRRLAEWARDLPSLTGNPAP